MKTPPTVAIHGPLRARINKLAHAAGLVHETRLRDDLFDQVGKAKAAGASFDELTALVDSFDAVNTTR
ncbi:hypothetical protein BH11PSE11_BH11PSE11_12250 [soil metagenome]